jgi:hypothetical protein
MASSNVHPVCEKIVEQLQLSLCKCVSNSKIYEYNNLDRIIDVKDCTNIKSYVNSLHATKTKVTIVPSAIKPATKYSLSYNVHERSVVMEEIDNYPPVFM